MIKNFIVTTDVLKKYPKIISEICDKNKDCTIFIDDEEINYLEDSKTKENIFLELYNNSNNIDYIFIKHTYSFLNDIINEAKEEKRYIKLITNNPFIKRTVENNLNNLKRQYKNIDKYLELKIEQFKHKQPSFSVHYLDGINNEQDINNLFSQERIIPSYVLNNDYIVIQDELQDVTSTFQLKNGKLKNIYDKKIKNNYYGEIEPKNIQQTCLFNSLLDKDNSIVYAGGLAGSGKSFVITNYALQELEKNKIEKIIFVPNNSISDDSRDIGLLPGTLYEKEISYMGTLVDIVGKSNIDKMYNDDKNLEIMPISLARGRNIKNSIIIVNEAQNLTEYHIKLLISRCGDGTRIFFDGDLKQADKESFRDRSGLRLLLKLRESKEYSGIFSAINLIKIERGFTASAVDFLDNL